MNKDYEIALAYVQQECVTVPNLYTFSVAGEKSQVLVLPSGETFGIGRAAANISLKNLLAVEHEDQLKGMSKAKAEGVTPDRYDDFADVFAQQHPQFVERMQDQMLRLSLVYKRAPQGE
jgi:hypothetical protein